MSCPFASCPSTRPVAVPPLAPCHRLSAPKRPTVIARVASPCSRVVNVPMPAADESASSSSKPGPRVQSLIGDEYFKKGDNRPIILFDGICNMCNAGVNMVLDFDKSGAYRFAALQSEAGRKLLQRVGRRPDDISSIVVVAENGSWIKSDAVLKIAEALTMPFPLFSSVGVVLPEAFRDYVYDWVAKNRYRLMGERDACRLMQPEWKDRFLY